MRASERTMIELTLADQVQSRNSLRQAMERTSFAHMQCSLAQTLEIVGDWWTPLILRDLFLGVRPFRRARRKPRDLAKSPDAPPRRAGEARARLARALPSPPCPQPIPVDRSGTRTRSDPRRYDRLGRSLGAPPGGGAIGFFHADCGRRFTPRIVCSECGGILDGAAMKGVASAAACAGPGIAVIARKLAQP